MYMCVCACVRVDDSQLWELLIRKKGSPWSALSSLCEWRSSSTWELLLTVHLFSVVDAVSPPLPPKSSFIQLFFFFMHTRARHWTLLEKCLVEEDFLNSLCELSSRYHTILCSCAQTLLIYWIVSQSTIVWLFSCYTEQNVNQCFLNGSVAQT